MLASHQEACELAKLPRFLRACVSFFLLGDLKEGEAAHRREGKEGLFLLRACCFLADLTRSLPSLRACELLNWLLKPLRAHEGTTVFALSKPPCYLISSSSKSSICYSLAAVLAQCLVQRQISLKGSRRDIEHRDNRLQSEERDYRTKRNRDPGVFFFQARKQEAP